MSQLTRKYSEDLKVMVVKEYQEGKLGMRPLANKYGIQSKSLIHRWIKAYEKFGEKGLVNRRSTETYTVQFKLDVLSFMKRTGSSAMETALHFGITNSTTVSRWMRAITVEGGLEGLNKQKGRPPMSKNKKKQEPMTNEQRLERENELLRLEVEYLKKLRAFQMDPEGYLEKHKQRYHTNSKKPSN